MLQFATIVSIGTDALEGPIDNGEFDVASVGEMGQRNQTDASQLGEWSIPVTADFSGADATGTPIAVSIVRGRAALRGVA